MKHKIKRNYLLNLINVYKQATKDEHKFLKSRSMHWEEFYKENEKFKDLKNLINFRKNRILSKGLDDAANVQNKLSLLELFESFDSNFLKKNLPDSNIGNSQHSINFLGYWFDYGIVHHLRWFEKINKYIKNNSIILEIGGGFGSLARIILKNKNVKYFLVDLPEANLMSHYYLKSHFPKKKFFNYLDFKKKGLNKNINKYDIFILPPNVIDKENLKFDFIINCRSFMEMNKVTIKKYFNLIQNNISPNGFFLNVNRYLKNTVKENIKIEEYPYDNFWKVIISEKSYLQPHMHFLLTKRNKYKPDIEKELLKLKKKNLYWKSASVSYFNIIKHKIKIALYFVFKKIMLKIFSKKRLIKISKIIYNLS